MTRLTAHIDFTPSDATAAVLLVAAAQRQRRKKVLLQALQIDKDEQALAAAVAAAEAGQCDAVATEAADNIGAQGSPVQSMAQYSNRPSDQPDTAAAAVVKAPERQQLQSSRPKWRPQRLSPLFNALQSFVDGEDHSSPKPPAAVSPFALAATAQPPWQSHQVAQSVAPDKGTDGKQQQKQQQLSQSRHLTVRHESLLPYISLQQQGSLLDQVMLWQQIQTVLPATRALSGRSRILSHPSSLAQLAHGHHATAAAPQQQQQQQQKGPGSSVRKLAAQNHWRKQQQQQQQHQAHRQHTGELKKALEPLLEQQSESASTGSHFGPEPQTPQTPQQQPEQLLPQELMDQQDQEQQQQQQQGSVLSRHHSMPAAAGLGEASSSADNAQTPTLVVAESGTGQALESASTATSDASWLLESLQQVGGAQLLWRIDVSISVIWQTHMLRNCYQ